VPGEHLVRVDRVETGSLDQAPVDALEPSRELLGDQMFVDAPRQIRHREKLTSFAHIPGAGVADPVPAPIPYGRSVMITAPMSTALTGFGAGLSLIVAIGAQNAFVLRQGLRREYVGLVVLVCAVSDALLIVAGISGIGAILERLPVVLDLVRYAGAAFLVGYGLLAARRACTASRIDADPTGGRTTLRATVLTCAALTWLNPHVYLDTVLLLGSIANTHGDSERWFFAIGAVTASCLWFSALGYGARLLRPVFADPRAWRILDAVIAVVMVTIAVTLLMG
jgi:L-lysine exporter family protein LysE/ArgO